MNATLNGWCIFVAIFSAFFFFLENNSFFYISKQDLSIFCFISSDEVILVSVEDLNSATSNTSGTEI